MAGKGSRPVGMRVLAVLVVVVLAMELVPAAALAETIAMREEPVATVPAGATEEMVADGDVGRETPAPTVADQPNQEADEVSVAPQAGPAPVADPVLVDGTAEVGLDTQAASVSAPRVRQDSSMESGQVTTWDCVWLGSYPQTEVPETDALRMASWSNGDATVGGVRYRRISRDDATYSGYWPSDAGTYRYFRYEPIKWRILKVDGDVALAVADVALDCRQYHKNFTIVTWETSAVRSWLNGMGTVPYYTSVSEVVAPTPKSFPDVPSGAWYAGVVSRAAELGLISGYADGRFGPDNLVTRGQVAAILWNMAGSPGAGQGARDFPDVHPGAYYYNAVRWASSVGVVSGYATGYFGPENRVSREQLAVMLANYANNVAGRPAEESAADYVSMADGDKVSPWAVPAVGWCFRNQILSGSKGNVVPQGSASRVQAAKMVVYLRDMLG